MQRPPEYDNLIKTGYFHEVAPTHGYKEQYLKVAQAYLTDANQATTAASRYLLSYEAYYQLVQAVLEHFGVRTSDRQGHRIVAIQRVSCDLDLTAGELKLIMDFHHRRNESVYRAPLPPISLQEAHAMHELAKKTFISATQKISSIS